MSEPCNDPLFPFRTNVRYIGIGQRFAAFSKIWPSTILHLLPFILRTYFWMILKSFGLCSGIFSKFFVHPLTGHPSKRRRRTWTGIRRRSLKGHRQKIDNKTFCRPMTKKYEKQYGQNSTSRAKKVEDAFFVSIKMHN